MKLQKISLYINGICSALLLYSIIALLIFGIAFDTPLIAAIAAIIELADIPLLITSSIIILIKNKEEFKTGLIGLCSAVIYAGIWVFWVYSHQV